MDISEFLKLVNAIIELLDDEKMEYEDKQKAVLELQRQYPNLPINQIGSELYNNRFADTQELYKKYILSRQENSTLTRDDDGFQDKVDRLVESLGNERTNRGRLKYRTYSKTDKLKRQINLRINIKELEKDREKEIKNVETKYSQEQNELYGDIQRKGKELEKLYRNYDPKNKKFLFRGAIKSKRTTIVKKKIQELEEKGIISEDTKAKIESAIKNHSQIKKLDKEIKESNKKVAKINRKLKRDKNKISRKYNRRMLIAKINAKIPSWFLGEFYNSRRESEQKEKDAAYKEATAYADKKANQYIGDVNTLRARLSVKNSNANGGQSPLLTPKEKLGAEPGNVSQPEGVDEIIEGARVLLTGTLDSGVESPNQMEIEEP